MLVRSRSLQCRCGSSSSPFWEVTGRARARCSLPCRARAWCSLPCRSREWSRGCSQSVGLSVPCHNHRHSCRFACVCCKIVATVVSTVCGAVKGVDDAVLPAFAILNAQVRQSSWPFFAWTRGLATTSGCVPGPGEREREREGLLVSDVVCTTGKSYTKFGYKDKNSLLTMVTVLFF